jgi:hypothetical protein
METKVIPGVDSDDEEMASKDEKLSDLIARIHQAKKQLRDYLNETNMHLAEVKCGGSEGRATKFALASLNDDNDGTLSEKEMEKFEETTKESVEKTLGLLLNSGVVGALILSMLFGLSFNSVTYATPSVNFFGNGLCDVIYYLMFIAITISTFGSLLLIFASLRIYTHLAFWLCTTKSKLKYLSEVSMAYIAILANLVLFSAMAAIPFAAAIIVSPGAGLISSIALLITTLGGIHYAIESKLSKTAIKFSVEEVEELLGMKCKFVVQ